MYWLDQHIKEQAEFYGLTPQQKAKLFEGAAEYGELIQNGEVNEPRRKTDSADLPGT
jgi:hypothetical protein